MLYHSVIYDELHPFMTLEHFDPIQEIHSKAFYDSLGEKDARRFAAVLYETTRDMKYICKLLVVSEKTVRK